MPDSIIINKVASVERCIERILEDYYGHEAEFETNFMRQDAILLNLQRACEQAIDIANHLVRLQGLGAPQSTRDAFVQLEKAGIIDSSLSSRLSLMVGFRNIAVHEYSKIDLNIVRAIIEKHLDDFRKFGKTALQFV